MAFRSYEQAVLGGSVVALEKLGTTFFAELADLAYASIIYLLKQVRRAPGMNFLLRWKSVF